MIFSKIQRLSTPGLKGRAVLSPEFSVEVTRAWSDGRTGVPARAHTAEGGATALGRMAGGGRGW